MSQYVLLLHRGGWDTSQYQPADYEAMMAKFVSWTEGLQREGALKAVERLKDPAQGKVVHRQGGTLSVDGPYTEAKEAVLGLYIVEARDLEAALAIAKNCPTVQVGGVVEVRETDASFPRP
jgi:hypothetical protein